MQQLKPPQRLASGQTAVAEAEVKPQEGDAASDSGTACSSIPGDTVGSETDAEDPVLRQRRLAPKTPIEGNPQRGPSSKYNKEWEVGNFGLFFGNWGLRGTLGDKEQTRRRAIQDRQILRNPGQVVMSVEASRQLEPLLQQPPPEEGYPSQAGVRSRGTHEYFCGSRQRRIGLSGCLPQ